MFSQIILHIFKKISLFQVCVELLIRFALVRNRDDFKTWRQLVYHFVLLMLIIVFSLTFVIVPLVLFSARCDLSFHSFCAQTVCSCNSSPFWHTHLQSSFCCWRGTVLNLWLLILFKLYRLPLCSSVVANAVMFTLTLQIEVGKKNNTLVAITWLTRKCPF